MALEKTVKKMDVLVLGDMSVGKSALISRFVFNTFEMAYSPTFGIDFLSKMIYRPDSVLRIQFWDAAGRKCFESLLPQYIRDTRLVLIVYDVSRRASFDAATKFVEQVQQEHLNDAYILMIGNKCDVSTAERQVSSNEAQTKAEEYGIAFCETSAQSNIGVGAAFERVITAGASEETNKTMRDQEELEKEKQRQKEEAEQAELILPSLPAEEQPTYSCGCNFVWGYVASVVKSTVYGMDDDQQTQAVA